MPSAWFGEWTGDIRRAKVRLNKNYDLEMKSLFQQLNLIGLRGEPLAQAKGQPKRGKDLIWIGRNISVFISKVVHTEFTTVGGTGTPIFEFEVVVSAREIVSNTGRVGRNMELAYSGPLIVTYPAEYPGEYPTFKLPKYRNFRPGLGSAHDNHMYAGGKMCLYGDFGRDEAAWDREHDTAAKAFAQAVKWIAWHELWMPRYGVDADDINRYF
jgi:hypothetical protein